MVKKIQNTSHMIQYFILLIQGWNPSGFLLRVCYLLKSGKISAKNSFFFYSYLYKLDFTFWLCFTASSPSAEGTLLWREQPPTAHSCSLTTRRWSFDIEGGYRCTHTAFYSVLVYYSEPFKERSGILLEYLKNYSQTPFLAPLDYLCAFVAGQKYGSLGFISLFLMLRLVFCCTVLSFW